MMKFRRVKIDRWCVIINCVRFPLCVIIVINTERNNNYTNTAHAVRNGGHYMSDETLLKHLFLFNASNSLVNDIFSTTSVLKKAL